ncbi:MAG: GxGYxYP domain-containing protein [Armatimonadota bacterium]
MPEFISSRSYLFVFLLILGLTICVPACAREYVSIRQSVLTEPIADPAKYRIKDEVVVFDLWKYFDQAGIKETTERADVVYLLTSLQGIVNRTRPRLFVLASLALFDVEKRVYYDPQYKEKPVTELDAFWLAELQRKGYIRKMRKTSDLADLIRSYRSELSGLALWEMKVPATANAALIAAGCDNLLPVSRDLGNGHLRQWMTGKFPDLKVKIDLTNRFNGQDPIKLSGKTFPSTGSAKNDVYRFVIEKYQKPGLMNPYYMWYNCDGAMWGAQRNHYAASAYGYLGDRNEIQQNGMYNADYWVAKRAFILDLLPWGDTTPNDDPKQKVGTDLATWNDILHASYTQRKGEFGVVGGFPPWWLKYTDVVGDKHEGVPTEWEFIALITSYNMVNEGDAAFGISNASFYMHLPKMTPSEVKITPPPDVQYKDGTTYIAFCMLDYDGSAWVNQMVPPVYNDSERGKLPLNWCINPIIHLRIPHAMRYLYEHRTPLDYFGFAADGTGYLNPLQLSERHGRVKESGIKAFEQFANTIHKRYGVDHTAFYISTRFAPSWAEMAARIDKGFGYGTPIPQQLVNGVPASFVQSFHVAQMREFEAELRRVFADSVGRSGYSPTFKTYRCIIVTPSMITGIIEKLRKEFPEAKVEVTDLRNYYRLLGQKLRSPLKSPYSDAVEVTAQPDAHQGLRAVPSSGGYFEIQTVQGSKAWSLKQMQHGLFLCIDVDDAFTQRTAGKPMEVEVEYLDQGTGTIELQYDLLDPAAPLDGAYKNARPVIELKDSGEWRTASFRVDDPRLNNRQNDATDFRLAKAQNDTLVIRRVTLRPCTGE